MNEIRRDTRFAEMELLAPEKPAGAVPWPSRGTGIVSDAEFVSLVKHKDATSARPQSLEAPTNAGAAPGLGLLKRNIPFDAAANAEESAMSPGFVAFTLAAAFGVFWLCGGHALLY